VTIHSGDDRRRFVPLALVSVLTTLIEDLPDVPTERRVELRSIRARLCRVFGIDNPGAPANASTLAQDLEDADGVPLEA